MKILIFAHVEPTGGTGTYFKRLLEFLDTSTNQLVLALQKKYSRKLSYLDKYNVVPYIKYDIIDNFIYRVFRKFNIHLKYEFIRDKYIIRSLIKKIQPDICLISQGGGIEYYASICYSLPTIIINHTITSESSPSSCSIYKKSFFKNESKGNKAFIFMSDYAKNVFIQHSPFYSPQAITTTIPNYASQVLLQRDKDSNTNTISILTMGHLNDYKNPVLWLSVAQLITRDYPQVHFYWAGIGDFYDKLSDKAKTNSNIHFLGFVKPEQAYTHCDIYFQPSKIESQGIAVVEAMSLSIPCVVSNAGGLPESVTDGYNGFVCKVDDLKSYVDKLILLINNSNLRNEMGLNSKHIYEEKFTLKQWQKQMVSTINKVLKKDD